MQQFDIAYIAYKYHSGNSFESKQHIDTDLY